MLFLGSLTFTRKPDKPTILVEGVNSTNVDLIWDILPSGDEVVEDLFLIRQRPGDVNQVAIASRKSSTSFTLLSDSFANEYSANLPATLRLLNVDNTEEYVYTLQVDYDLYNRPRRMEDRVTVIVRGKSNNFAFLPSTCFEVTGHSSVYPPDFNRDSIQCLFFYCVPERNSRHYEVKKKQKLFTAVFFMYSIEWENDTSCC